MIGNCVWLTDWLAIWEGLTRCRRCILLRSWEYLLNDEGNHRGRHRGIWRTFQSLLWVTRWRIQGWWERRWWRRWLLRCVPCHRVRCHGCDCHRIHIRVEVPYGYRWWGCWGRRAHSCADFAIFRMLLWRRGKVWQSFHCVRVCVPEVLLPI